ncbi:MAG: hypothetical protein ACI3ZH_06655, partial [Candidatus Cryptobacteroides sp.]
FSSTVFKTAVIDHSTTSPVSLVDGIANIAKNLLYPKEKFVFLLTHGMIPSFQSRKKPAIDLRYPIAQL